MGLGRRGDRRKSDAMAAHALVLTVLSVAWTGIGFGRASAASSADPTTGDLIGALKRLEKKLGFRKTKNFRSYSTQSAADYRCYYTGKLELPESYDGLKLTAGTKDGCTVDAKKFDVFFYPVEAVGSGKSPITSSLEHASVERVLVVVPHEDFHGSEQLGKLPATLNEAAATLIGFLTAAQMARGRFGDSSDVYRNLLLEPELFLRKSAIVNNYHARVAKLYAAAQSGELAEQEALAQKANLFQQAEGECQEITPAPRSFNRCLSADNNAGLAFDETYCKYYPMMYQLHAANGQDLRETLKDLKQVLAAGSEAEAVEGLRALTNKRTAAPPGGAVAF
jgi:Putative aminopeptidase